MNIVLDLVFVINFGLAVRGVAVATLIAQGISAVLSFMILMRKLKGYQEEQKYRYYDRDMMVSMVRIAIPSTVQQSIVQMGILLVQSVVNSFGSAVLAGYSAGYPDRVYQHRADVSHGKRDGDLRGPEYRRGKAGADPGRL